MIAEEFGVCFSTDGKLCYNEIKIWKGRMDMNNSKWKLKTLIALTALTVVAVPVCLQKKSANAASKYTYKRVLLMRQFLQRLKRGLRGSLIVRIRMLSYLIFDMFRCFIMGLMEK